MINIKYVCHLSLLPLALSFTSCNGKQEQLTLEKPNIIYILADDMGYGDIGTYNDESKIPTPALDAMATNGILYTDAHSNSAVSTPTRYGTVTGRYAFRTKLKKGVLTGYSAPLVEENRETIATLLNKHGYQTGCVGKWHLGLNWVKKDPSKPLYTGDEWNIENTDNVDYKKYIGGGPTACGFDYSYILPASLDMSPYVYIENGYITAPVNGYTEHYSKKGVHGVFYRKGDVADDFNHRECLFHFTQKSEEFIANASKSDNPYFLYFPLTAPHSPWLLEEGFDGKSKAGIYGDFVTMVDETVRRIYQAVEESGEADNTLIIFTSDNGSMWLDEDIERTGHRSNGKWSGKKSDIWEGGHRVPFLATWPATIEPQRISNQLISSTDLYATLAEMTNETTTDNSGEDSYSFWQTIANGKDYQEKRGRQSMVYHSIEGYFGLRKENWVLLDCKGSGGWTLTENDAKDLPDIQLYNLKTDPTQQNNVADTNQDVVAELQRELEAIKAKM